MTFLPFEEIDAAASERRGELLMAVARLGGDLHLRDFVLMVLSATGRGRRYEATYQAIAATPLGLCCSIGKARKTAEAAVATGLVAKQASDRGTAQRANRYAIDWPGVSRILTGRLADPRMDGNAAGELGGDVADPRMDGDECHTGRPATTAQRDALSWQRPATTAQAAATAWQASARARAGSGESVFDATHQIPNANTPAPAPEPAPEFGRCGNAQALPTWLSASPILAEAARRRITAKASPKITASVFEPLDGAKLDRTPWMVGWFRAQLAAADPVLGDSEVDLLLAIAWGLYAARLPAAEVRRTRAAVFANCCRRRIYRHAGRYLREARERLDDYLAALAAHDADQCAAIHAARSTPTEAQPCPT